MIEFEKVTDRDLVALPSQIAVHWAGLDFEMGGTMQIDVHHDPALTSENMVQNADLSELAKRVNNPQLLERVRLKATTSLYSSPLSRKILRLPFASRPNGNTMVWHLVRETEELISTINGIPNYISRDIDPFKLFASVLNSLPLLSCWKELNNDRFSKYKITIDSDLASRIPDVLVLEDSGVENRVVVGCGVVG